MPTFNPPTIIRRPHWARSAFDALMYKWPQGKTVWKDSGGTWHEQSEPAQADLDAAAVVAVANRPGGWQDRYVFIGGYTWTVSAAVATELTDAGYGAYLT